MTNINFNVGLKTINGNSLIGSGNIVISTGITIGTTPIASGANDRILFQSGGVVQQSSRLTYNGSTLEVQANGTSISDIPFKVMAGGNEVFSVRGNNSWVLRGLQYNTNVDVIFSYVRIDSPSLATPLLYGSPQGYIAVGAPILGGRPEVGVLFNGAYAKMGLGVDVRNEIANQGSRNIAIGNGIEPTATITDTAFIYTADQGGVAGRASIHFRSEEGTINTLGYFNGFGYSSGTPLGARIDVLAQGALSTDIAFRIRNYGNTNDIIKVRGDEVIEQSKYVEEVTGALISFKYPQEYNTATTPTTSNITNDLTSAKKGVIQKIYHNKSTAPTFPAGWVNLSGIYVPNVLNIIYCCWAGGSRVEYWIIQG